MKMSFIIIFLIPVMNFMGAYNADVIKEPKYLRSTVEVLEKSK